MGIFGKLLISAFYSYPYVTPLRPPTKKVVARSLARALFFVKKKKIKIHLFLIAVFLSPADDQKTIIRGLSFKIRFKIKKLFAFCCFFFVFSKKWFLFIENDSDFAGDNEFNHKQLFIMKRNFQRRNSILILQRSRKRRKTHVPCHHTCFVPVIFTIYQRKGSTGPKLKNKIWQIGIFFILDSIAR